MSTGWCWDDGREHKDSGNVNVGRVVFNLGGGGVVNLRCGDEELKAWKEKAGREAANLPPTPRDKRATGSRVR
ncbi:hypothetical protein HaLaN_01651 [Haematococcus lacustris]|uniref:Uncharacterized protein n=1 Tax=Haematococcus lacustris TaxID=44745 RepID=A0A699YLN2_HAELA|nr:hypothetical protein HaLaN_01651 [Haematococcus lacustris]